MAMRFAFVSVFVGAFVSPPACFGRLRMGSEQGFYLNCSVRTRWFHELAMLGPREGHVWVVGKNAESDSERLRAILGGVRIAPLSPPAPLSFQTRLRRPFKPA